MCNTTPCKYDSVCQKIYTTNPKYDKTYYCSLNLEIQYLNNMEARTACLNNCGNGKYNINNKKCYILE